MPTLIGVVVRGCHVALMLLGAYALISDMVQRMHSAWAICLQ